MRGLHWVLLVLLIAFGGIGIADAGNVPRLYWSHWNGDDYLFYSANLDGSDIRQLDGVGNTWFTIDKVGGKLYWHSVWPLPYALWRANLDGSAAEELYPEETFADDLAVDPAAGKVYSGRWAPEANGSLHRRNLDGSDFETINNCAGAHDVYFDPPNQKLYWYWCNTGYVQSNPDGGEIQLMMPTGYHAIAIDTVREKIYWAESNGTTHGRFIKRKNFDHTEVETLVSTVESVKSIAVDTVRPRFYWSENGKIRSAALDGTDIQTFDQALQPRAQRIEIDDLGSSPVPASDTTTKWVLVSLMILVSTVILGTRRRASRISS